MNGTFQTILVGIGATATMDVYTSILNLFRIKTLDYRFVGRWIGHFFNGKFSHDSIVTASPVRLEQVIGWTAHYIIGISFAFLLVFIAGKKWLEQPTILPALIIGLATIIAPFFIMQPSFGLGIAGANLPSPNTARLMSLITHSVFGFGLYLSEKLLVFSLAKYKSNNKRLDRKVPSDRPRSLNSASG